MKLLICGSRDWSEPVPIEAMVRGFKAIYESELLIIEGEAPGADWWAGYHAVANDVERQGFRADWALYGKAAGSIRNQRMLDEGKPQATIAFANDLKVSKGTADMVRRSLEAEIPTYQFRRLS